ncbi:hypothetical protein [Maridesulfovibrio salexigens]|uniref:Uncharacterized protein n=1 Tax=Maridesulfovibrio salexigens (strain ATCC 14822 / DSM 2638 / NCIMB 8403 / VKM B-1763) TaxID=526222 RepID=C6BRK9_MARSD|nr:hypothetical protein [Maridesulfovibrio salexigens]ACS79449.1 conserved hypothetical protein [Maridesulfovibrio salexigens DSM 2638]
MQITPNPEGKSILGISGHAGVGHVHSHCGFVQDDSAGFATAIEIIKKAYPADTTIAEVNVNIFSGEVTVTTKDGGTGKATARRGFTPHEAKLLAAAKNLDATYSQSCAFQVFGRIYGQGVLEGPVAFQSACCLAVMDTFEKKFPGSFIRGNEDMPNKIGGCIGTRLLINETPVSILALVNANEGGLGPDEDLEGNIALGDKGRAMKDLDLDRLPTIILESKAYVPSICEGVDHDRMWVRINAESDNQYVYEALLSGIEAAGLPHLSSDTAYPRHTGELKGAVQALGRRITEIGNNFTSAETSAEKVKLISELALLVSQDAGGVTFMSAHMHDQVGGGGIMPGTSAVLSMVVSEDYIKEWKIPAFTTVDSAKYMDVIINALPRLAANAEKAQTQLEERFSFNEAEHEFLF